MNNPFDLNSQGENPQSPYSLAGDSDRANPNAAVDRSPTPDGPIEDTGVRPFPLLMAPLAMLFSPGRFFRYFAPRCPMVVVFVLAYMGGLMKYDGRMQMRYSPTHPTFGSFFENWTLYWGVGSAAALISAALVVAVGGWFYRVRIRWSGVPDADVRLSNTIFMTADTFTYLSGFIALTWISVRYDTPADYFYSDQFHAIEFVPLLFLLWSPVMSYRALREVFNINRVSGLIWFLILPIVTRLLAFGLIFVGLLLMNPGFGAQPPDLDQTAVYRGENLSFEYPGNWELELLDDDATVLLSPPQDAYVKIMIYASSSTPDDEIAYSVEGLEDAGASMSFVSEFSSYAGFDGVGRVFDESGLSPIYNYEFRVFVTPIADGWMLETQELGIYSDLEVLGPGFDLIEQTLRVE